MSDEHCDYKWHLDEGPMDEERERAERRLSQFEVADSDAWDNWEDGPRDYMPISIQEALYRNPDGKGVFW